MNKTLADILRILVLLFLLVLAVFTIPETTQIQKVANASNYQQVESPVNPRGDNGPASEKDVGKSVSSSYSTSTGRPVANPSIIGKEI